MISSKGSANLSIYRLLIMHIYKQMHPILHVIKITLFFFSSTRKIIIIKWFYSVLDVLYIVLLSMGPFSYVEWRWCFNFKKWYAWGHYVPPSSVEMGYLPYSLTIYERNRSTTTSMFLSLNILCAKILLFSGSIAIQSQMNSNLSLSMFHQL